MGGEAAPSAPLSACWEMPGPRATPTPHPHPLGWAGGCQLGACPPLPPFLEYAVASARTLPPLKVEAHLLLPVGEWAVLARAGLSVKSSVFMDGKKDFGGMETPTSAAAAAEFAGRAAAAARASGPSDSPFSSLLKPTNVLMPR